MSGKKSRPTSNNITAPRPSINTATIGTMARRRSSVVRSFEYPSRRRSNPRSNAANIREKRPLGVPSSLRFHVLDAVDVGADGILAVGADALFHFRRGEAGVLPYDGHHRNADFRKNIGRHRSDGGDAQKQDQGPP